jgi:hypothetical protein
MEKRGDPFSVAFEKEKEMQKIFDAYVPNYLGICLLEKNTTSNNSFAPTTSRYPSFFLHLVTESLSPWKTTLNRIFAGPLLSRVSTDALAGYATTNTAATRYARRPNAYGSLSNRPYHAVFVTGKL